MTIASQKKTAQRLRRRSKIRTLVKGSATRPRLCVFKSNRYVVAQLIDDVTGRSLVYITTQTLAEAKGKSPLESADAVGAAIAARAKKVGITEVVFDRGGYRYTGIVKALADAVRAGGIVL